MMHESLRDAGRATEAITDRIRSDILSGVFPAGCRIKIADLAERYAISAMPIREALRTLDGEGLVTIIPNKGAKVRAVDADFVRNLYEIRGALEAMLVERACQNMTLTAQREIEITQERLEACVAADDADGVLEANGQFHQTINRLGENPEALRLLRLGQSLILSFRRQLGFQGGRLTDIASEHRALMEAIWARDVSRAAAISRMHTNSACLDLIACLKD